MVTSKTNTPPGIRNKKMHGWRLPSYEKIILITICIFWVIVVWLLGLGKIFLDGLVNYAIHFTNWSWTINGVYLLLDLVSCLDKTGKLSFYVISIGFWLVNGVSWIVFTLIFIVLHDNPDLLINMSDRGSGEQTLGFIMDMDRVFHVLPALVILLYMFMRRDKIGLVVYVFMNKRENQYALRFNYAFISMISPVLFTIIYCITVDIYAIYGITTRLLYIVLIGFVTLVVCNIVPFIVFVRKYAYSKHSHERFGSYADMIVYGHENV